MEENSRDEGSDEWGTDDSDDPAAPESSALQAASSNDVVVDDVMAMLTARGRADSDSDDEVTDLREENGRLKAELETLKAANPLKAGWEVLVDEASGESYYHHKASGETSWHKPDRAATPDSGQQEVPSGSVTDRAWRSLCGAPNAAAGDTAGLQAQLLTLKTQVDSLEHASRGTELANEALVQRIMSLEAREQQQNAPSNELLQLSRRIEALEREGNKPVKAAAELRHEMQQLRTLELHDMKGCKTDIESMRVELAELWARMANAVNMLNDK